MGASIIIIIKIIIIIVQAAVNHSPARAARAREAEGRDVTESGARMR